MTVKIDYFKSLVGKHIYELVIDGGQTYKDVKVVKLLWDDMNDLIYLSYIENNSIGFYCDVKTIKSVSTDGVLSQWFDEDEI
tara:strand:- start:1581 stop:1826 length:246 start_codon:yes stop_codon:yes gene_type:complete